MPEVRFTGTDNLTCTSHVLRMYSEEELMAIARDNAGPGCRHLGTGRPVGRRRRRALRLFPNSDTWSVKTNQIEARDLEVTGGGAADGPWCLWRGLEVA